LRGHRLNVPWAAETYSNCDPNIEHLDELGVFLVAEELDQQKPN
jgi:hypothetical protein